MALTETKVDPWRLTADEQESGCVYLANGYLGTIVSPDGGLVSGDAGAWHMRGLYVLGEQHHVDRLAVLPHWSGVQYAHDAAIEQYRRTLDLHDSLLTTRFLLEEDRGTVDVEQTIFLSRAKRHHAVTRLTLTPSFEGSLSFRMAVGGEPAPDVAVQPAPREDGSVLLQGRTRTYDIPVELAVRVLEDRWTCRAEPIPGGITCMLSTHAGAGEAVTLTVVSTVVSGVDTDTPGDSASREPSTYDGMWSAHAAAWNDLWQTDIEIEGDPEIQQFARSALFSLWSTVAPDDRWSIAPMGLSSNGYNGHIFWDAEFWMYPSLLLTQPDLARSCVAYREWTVPAARQRAAANGMRGTQYPWEAAFSGEEMTPRWAETRDFQLHVTADVAIAQWWYYLTTLDREWLRDHGYPVIRECAEYWVSRVEWHPERQRYEISDVVCADEYAAHVNNDAFTNAAVRAALSIAIRASELVGMSAPEIWRRIAETIHIPYDPEHRRHLEYDGFDGRLTKQADVELLAFPLEAVQDSEQVARDLDFYAGVIDPDGPAMSFSVYAIVSAYLGRGTDALAYLRRAFVPNTRPPFWLFSETPTNEEFHFLTGVGGALQAFLYGFSGIRLREGYTIVDPLLPPGWTRLHLRGLVLCGARCDLDIRPDAFTLRRAVDGGTVAVEVCRPVEGNTVDITVTSETETPVRLALAEEETQADGRSDAVSARLSLRAGLEHRVRVVDQSDRVVLDFALRGR